MTAHNEVSRLFVGEERPLNRSFAGSETVVPGAGGTIVTPGTTDIEFRPVGTTLLITPSINADRTVTLRVLQETSSIAPEAADVLVPSAQGFTQEQVDVVQTRTVSGTVVAQDGLAIALGGLIEEQTSDRRQMIPGLGRLPLLGVLFRRQVTEESRSELVIMIRPYVLNTPAESEQISRELLEELSIHPSAPEGRGTLELFDRSDVLGHDAVDSRLQNRFEFHSDGKEGLEP